MPDLRRPDLKGEVTLCYECEDDRTMTGKMKVVEQRRDPTEVYELDCGHWVI